ncbi:MAG: 6-pyruvoyl trahydropterin synthase family protein [Phycisphaeraceae bacterium]
MADGTYEITVETVFPAAHTLRLPDGSDEPLHGHNWQVAVTVARAGLDAMETVMDFHELERIVETIIAPWRNQHLNEQPPFVDQGVNPSAERVAWWIGKQTAAQLPEGVRLVDVRVGEAPGCTAVYRP